MAATPALCVTLGGESHAVTIPPRFAERREILSLAYANAMRGAAAAVAICCPSLKLKAANLVSISGITADLGARAWEELDGRGIEAVDLFTEAQTIISAINEAAFPNAPEVKAQEDFTGRAAAVQTSQP